jgi:hypothetical protein
MNHEILVFNGVRPERQPATDTLILTGPLDTVTHHITATAELILMPGGTGGIQASTSGDARGDYALDLQLTTTANTQVASGDASMILGGVRNTAAGAGTIIIGGEDNVVNGPLSCIVSCDIGNIDADSIRSLIGGGKNHVLINSDTFFIGAGENCTANASNSGVIAGGISCDMANAIAGVIGGGSNNDVLNTAAIIAGGQSNQASGDRAFIGGGRLNVNAGDYAGIAAGYSCDITAAGDYGFVGGGKDNVVAAVYGTLSGGEANDVTGDYSTISGGINNEVATSNATIGGGNFNTITAAGYFGTISGGSSNNIAGDYGAIGGGTLNKTAGIGACIPGGAQHTANGNYSVCLGRYAVAEFHGCISHAANQIAQVGDSMTMTVQMQGVTLNATSSLLYTNGSNEKLVMTPNTCWVFRALVNGFSFTDAAESVGYLLLGVARRTGAGDIAILGIPNSTVLGRDNVGHSVTVSANTTTQSLDFIIQGTANTVMAWAGKVELVHVDNI